MFERTVLSALLLAVVAVVWLTSGAGAEALTGEYDVQIEQHGPGVALEDAEKTYLWQHEPYTVEVRFETAERMDETVCLSPYESESESITGDQPFVCEQAIDNGNSEFSARLTQSEWPEDISGDELLAVEIYPDANTAGEPRETVVLPVHIFEPDGDLAGNGLTNEREIELGTHPEMADTDGDGLTDAVEVFIGTSPRNPMTPYKILLALLGTLAIGAVGTVLLADRVRLRLQSGEGRASGESATTQEAQTEATQQTFEPPVRDEVRVQQLLDANEGRLKQSQIVEATDWSKSKVSRLLSTMEDDGEITRIRLGRENLVCLRGHEPPDVTPSWDKSP